MYLVVSFSIRFQVTGAVAHQIGRAQAPCTTDSGVHIIESQADADALSGCDTVNGSMIVSIENQTEVVSMDRIRYIMGELTLNYDSNMTSFSMKSLAEITGDITLTGHTLENIDLPELSSVGHIMNISNVPLLSNLNLSNLSSTGFLAIDNLPSLQEISFDSGLKQITGWKDRSSYGHNPALRISNTSLARVTGLLFTHIDSLTLQYNPNLESLTLFLNSMYCNGTDTSPFTVAGNPKLSFSLPYLKTIQNCGMVEIEQLSNLSIPELTSIEGSFIFSTSSPTVFDAPSLISVLDYFSIDKGDLAQINLPALQTVAELDISDNPAIHQPNGIYVPSLTNSSGFRVRGTSESEAECQVLNNQRCRGLIGPGYYSCNGEEVGIASNPNTCQNTYPTYGWTLVEKLEIGLVLPLCLIISASFICFCWRRIKKQRATKATQALVQGHELDSNEQLPKYQQHDVPDEVLPSYNSEQEQNMASDVPNMPEAIAGREMVQDVGRSMLVDETHHEAPREVLPMAGHEMNQVSPVSPVSPVDRRW